jgi:energy-coupling factor transporter ATP-binding protein EcfA2
MSFLKKCLEWTKTRPEWQADLFRRALEQNADLSAGDSWNDIRGMVRKAIGVPIEGEKPPPTPIRPDPAGFSGANPEQESIVLKSMTCLSSINAIPDGTDLPFGHSGITIVYGENGSGKSSYARVLKKACKARDTEDIHPNVFLPNSKKCATAKFKFALGQKADDYVTWSEESPSPTILSSVVVFDEKCARVMIDKENESRYAPYGADAFPIVSKAQQVLSKELAKERYEITKPDLAFRNTKSKASQFLAAIKGTDSEESILQKLVWTEENKARLDKVTELGKKARELNNETKLKAAKDSLTKISSAVQHLRDFEASFSIESITLFGNNISALETAKKERIVQASVKLGEEPLPGAGSEIWKSLFNAAREYSLKAAYPDSPFPVVGNEKLCVWCMQPLAESAVSRLKRFESFMDDSFAKKVKFAEAILEESKKPLLEFALWDTERFSITISQIQSENLNLWKNLNAAFTIRKDLHHEYIEKISTSSLFPFKPVEQIQEVEYNLWNNSKMDEIKAWEESIKATAIEALRNEFIELDDWRVLCESKESISNYLTKSKVNIKINLAIEELNTAPLTRQLNDLVNDFQTPELQRLLSKELEELGGTRLPITFISKGSAGQSKHRLHLSAHASHSKINVSRILSEGEQRVIGLAGFFTELNLDEDTNPIIFDDPVTSLDHSFREKIAKRIAKESLKRQVIVFTHDLVFLFELKSSLAEIGSGSIQVITMNRENGTPGLCIPKPPWNVLDYSGRFISVESEMNGIFPLFSTDIGMYNEKIAVLFSKLRDALESLIEEEIFQSVVERFQREIKTLKLRGVSLEHNDYRTFYNLFDFCCTWMIGHSKSKSLNVNRPSPDDFRKKLSEITEFRKGLVKQRKAVDEHRKKMLEPQVGPIG